MEFLLPKGQLKGLSEEDQKAAKDEAFNQFLLGSIFGGGGISTGYQAVQNIIPNLQKQRQQQGLLQELGAINKEFFPTAEQEQAQALNANLGRPRTASSPYSLGTALGAPQANVQPQALQGEAPNYADLQTRLARLSLNPNAAPMISNLSSAFGAFKPNVVEGVAYDIRNRPTSVLQRADLKSGLQLGGSVENGNVNFQTAPISGFRSATARNALPERSKGEDYVFNANGDVVGIMNAAGAMSALAQRTATETAAREANIPRPSLTSTGAPTFTYATPPGLTGGVTQPAGVNQPVGVVQPTTAQPVTGPSTAQTILNEAYRPILADAYKGYQTANKTAPYIDILENAYNQEGFDTGSFTGLRTQLGNVFNSLGISGERNKEFLKNAISARQAINALTGESLTEAVGAISNFEINYYGQRNAQITDPKESTKFNLAILREVSKRKQDYYKFISDANNAGPDVLAKWQASPQGQKQMFESPSLRKFLPQLQVTAGPDKGKTAYQLPSGVFRVYD
jgi:hypothetical protein